MVPLGKEQGPIILLARKGTSGTLRQTSDTLRQGKGLVIL